MAQRIRVACGGAVAGKTVAVLGLTFKPKHRRHAGGAEPGHPAGAPA